MYPLVHILYFTSLFFGMALLSLFFMSQKQSSTPLNCIIHIRNLIKFSHLKIISNKLTTAINSLSSLGSIYFILVHARGLCYKKKTRKSLCLQQKRVSEPQGKGLYFKVFTYQGWSYIFYSKIQWSMTFLPKIPTACFCK